MMGHFLPAILIFTCLVADAISLEADGRRTGSPRNPFRSKKSDANVSGIAEKIGESIKKPCAIVVLSNAQNPYMHSLLRKYRYDAKGVLIPSSVRYFVKLPENGIESSTVLVPLHDKAFSPLGGFVRYYKEVPPIPQSW